MRDGRLMVHEVPRGDGMMHDTSSPASCWCEPEIFVKKYERVARHQDMKVLA